jgi:hypothetical protein
MKLQRHLDGLQDDLEQLGALGDDRTAEAAARLARGLEPSVRVRLLDILAEAAAELSESSDAHIEVRLVAGDPELIVVEQPEMAPAREGGEARITLRLAEDLKSRVDTAAAGVGVSTNTWIVSALSRTVSSQARRSSGGRRLTGYGRS